PARTGRAPWWAIAGALPVPATPITHPGPRAASATSRCSGSSAASTASGPSSTAHLLHHCHPCASVRHAGKLSVGPGVPSAELLWGRTGDAGVTASNDVHHAVVRLLPQAQGPASAGGGPSRRGGHRPRPR